MGISAQGHHTVSVDARTVALVLSGTLAVVALTAALVVGAAFREPLTLRAGGYELRIEGRTPSRRGSLVGYTQKYGGYIWFEAAVIFEHVVILAIKPVDARR